MAEIPWLQLARNTVAKGFSLSGSEDQWAAFHLAEQVLSLAEQVKKLEAERSSSA